MAQQILTAAAKLRGQADPVIALASASLLASLSMPDAHPSYLASSAAAVLSSQLLQADTHDIPALLGRTGPAGGGPGDGDGDGDGAPGAGPLEDAPPLGQSADPGLKTALTEALHLATEGQLGRMLAAELGPNSSGGGGNGGAEARATISGAGAAARIPRSHLTLALMSLVQATSTDSSKIHFSDRVKHNLRKVGEYHISITNLKV